MNIKPEFEWQIFLTHAHISKDVSAENEKQMKIITCVHMHRKNQISIFSRYLTAIPPKKRKKVEVNVLLNFSGRK